MIALTTLLAGVALAQEGSLSTSGDLRTLASTLTDFPVDADGTTHGQELWLDQRVRAGLEWTPTGLRVATEWEALTGQLAGDTWALEAPDARARDEHEALSLAGVRPRSLLAETVLGSTQVAAGLTTSSWGLGMLANDGATDPLFGRTDLGDRVVRLRATKLPSGEGVQRSSLLVTGAVDLVVQDDSASLSDEQTALQAIGSLMWLRGPRAKGRGSTTLGVYTVVRHQEESLLGSAEDPRTTDVLVLDGFADLPGVIGSWALRTRVEGAVIAGRTDRATTYAARRAVGVLSAGLAAHVSATDPDEWLTVHARGGIASGDGDPDDGAVHDFTFDPNFAAGMVLFDQVTGAVEASTYALASDPTVSGQPPDGIESVVTEGSVRRAAFVQPVVQLNPLPWGEVRLGAVFSGATAPVAQPFYTTRNGGVPTNHHDVAAEGRLLGTELDWALEVHRGPDDDTWWRPSLAVQGGHLLLGPPLQGAGPDAIHHVMGMARLEW